MPIYEVDPEEDEDGDLRAICPECEGSGWRYLDADEIAIGFGADDEAQHGSPKTECEICCGFGRLDR